MLDQDRQDEDLLQDVDALLNATQKPAPKEIDWSEYDFNFDDEFPPEPEIRRRVIRTGAPGSFSVDEMRRLHDGAPEGSEPEEDLPLRRPRPRIKERRTVQTAAPKRKHPFLKLLMTLLLVLALLLGVFALVMVIIAKMPTTDQPVGARKENCCTILLVGTDASGDLTDTMMLLHVDRNARQLSLLSLPRDTMVNRDNPVPKLNGAYYANGAGEKGMGYLMDYVRDLVGYRPDGYLMLGLDCFVQLVDTMGGVRYDVPMDMYYNDPSQDLLIDLKAGEQHLNGKQAMGLVRFRSGYAMADLERVNVQRDFLSQALHQWTRPWKLVRAPFALGLLLKNTQTDLTLGNLSWLAQAVLRCGTKDLRTDTLPGSPQTVNGGAYYVEDVWAAADLVNAAYNPYEKEITSDDLHPYGR